MMRLKPIFSTLVIGGMLLAGATAQAAPAMSDYVLFGENGIMIGVNSKVEGLVGARYNASNNNDAIHLNGRAMVDGDARSGGNVNLQNNASISGTVFRPAGTTLVLNSGASVGTDAFPVDPQLPAFPAATGFPCPPPGGADHSGAQNENLALVPGNYGNLNYGSGFSLTLNGAGNYYFNSITAGPNSKLIVTQEDTHVFVCEDARWASVEVTTPNSSNCDLTVEVHGNDDTAAFFAGGSTHWIGDVFAPYGGIHVGAGDTVSSFIGGLVSLYTDLEHNVTGHKDDCGPQPTSTPTPSPPMEEKDASNLHGSKDMNNGASLTLRASRRARTLIGFDVSGITDFASVKSAKLTVYVSNNLFDIPPFSPSSNWPMGGGQLWAARINDGYEVWVEGNGNNYPIMDNPRGTGEGVTWACVVDSNIANEARDCVPPLVWKMGGKKNQGPPIGPAIVTNTMTDGQKIVFDVTDSVKLGLGPKDKTWMTWALYGLRSGSIAFYSEQGAIAALKPAWAPTLTIEK